MSRYAESVGLFTFFLLAVCIVAIIVVISTFRALCFIFSSRNDRMAQQAFFGIIGRAYEPARLSGRWIAPLNGRPIEAT